MMIGFPRPAASHTSSRGPGARPLLRSGRDHWSRLRRLDRATAAARSGSTAMATGSAVGDPRAGLGHGYPPRHHRTGAARPRRAGKRDGSTVGGHVQRLVVSPTLEVVVTESPVHLRKKVDEETGLALVALDERA